MHLARSDCRPRTEEPMILPLMAVLCCGVTGYLAVPDDTPRRRLTRLLPTPDAPIRPGNGRDVRMRWAACGLAGFVCALLVGGPAGWAAGALVTLGCVRVVS